MGSAGVAESPGALSRRIFGQLKAGGTIDLTAAAARGMEGAGGEAAASPARLPAPQQARWNVFQ